MNAVIMSAFSDELTKLATPPVAAAGESGLQLAGKLLKKIPGKHVASAVGGASLLYGGHRLVQDVKAGEQLRKQQAGGGY